MTRGPKEASSTQLRGSLCASLMLNSGFLTLHPHRAWFEAISWQGAPSSTLCRQRQQQAHSLLPSMAHAWSWSCSSGRLLAQGRGSAPRIKETAAGQGIFPLFHGLATGDVWKSPGCSLAALRSLQCHHPGAALRALAAPCCCWVSWKSRAGRPWPRGRKPRSPLCRAEL